MRPCILLYVLVFLLAVSCNRDRTGEIQSAMDGYDQMVRTMDADGLAETYARAGRLGEMVGRDSIRRFLKTFIDVRMLDYQSHTTSIEFAGDSATQKGTYRQDVVVKADTLHLKGDYQTIWIEEDGRWRIRHMTTRPQMN